MVPKKILGPIELLLLKILGPQNIFGPRKILGPRKFESKEVWSKLGQ